MTQDLNRRELLGTAVGRPSRRRGDCRRARRPGRGQGVVHQDHLAAGLRGRYQGVFQDRNQPQDHRLGRGDRLGTEGCLCPRGITLRAARRREPDARIEHLWQKIYRSHRDMRGGPFMVNDLSGIDMALWDITGKLHGVPVYRLLGGPSRDRIRMYPSPRHTRPAPGGSAPVGPAGGIDIAAASSGRT